MDPNTSTFADLAMEQASLVMDKPSDVFGAINEESVSNRPGKIRIQSLFNGIPGIGEEEFDPSSRIDS